MEYKKIYNQEYFSLEPLNDDGSVWMQGIWAEALPYKGKLGAISFRVGVNTWNLACKQSDETWEEFLARLDKKWDAFPQIKALAERIAKIEETAE